MYVIRLAMILAAASCAFAPAQADDLLRWKLSTGDTLNYRVSNAMQMTNSTGGLETQTQLTQVMEMVWDVETVLTGGFVVNQVIQRITVELSPNGIDKFRFDSGDNEVPANRIVLSLGNVFRKIVDQKFVVRMESTGNVTDVSIPDDLLETLSAAAAGSASALDEKSLRQMMSQATVILPDRAVAKGARWESKQTIELPFATLEMSPQMTYRGLNEDGYAVIDYVPHVELSARGDAPVQMKLSSSDGRGQVIFDLERGRVVRMDLNMQMQMVASVNGQTNTQTVTQRTKMELVEKPAR